MKNLIFNRRGALCAPVGWIWFCFAGERSSPLRDYIIPFVVLAAAERTNLSVGEGLAPPAKKSESDVSGGHKALPSRGYIVPLAIRLGETR